MWQGSINHVSITVSDLALAMDFLGPLLELLGYERGERLFNEEAGVPLTVNVNAANGTAINVWEARPGLADHPFEVYEPGLHHVAWNVDAREKVDEVRDLVRRLGGEVLAGPGEFPYAVGGYYAVYFRGPDRLKFEVTHMPELGALFGAARGD